jgi:tRNA pseudouridine55 synthase
LAPVPVTIHETAVRDWTPPDCTVTARVGKGTYLRAMARDLGDALGIPAHCAALRRTAIGPFRVEDAIAPADASLAVLRAPAVLVQHLPRVVLDAAGCREIGFGRAVARESDLLGPIALLGEDGRLVAIAEAGERGWHPVVVLEPAA